MKLTDLKIGEIYVLKGNVTYSKYETDDILAYWSVTSNHTNHLIRVDRIEQIMPNYYNLIYTSFNSHFMPFVDQSRIIFCDVRPILPRDLLCWQRGDVDEPYNLLYSADDLSNVLFETNESTISIMKEMAKNQRDYHEIDEKLDEKLKEALQIDELISKDKSLYLKEIRQKEN